MFLEGVVTRALEANRLTAEALSRQARPISQAAALLVEALATGRSVHLLGDGALALQASYLAEVLQRGDGKGLLPARLLADRAAGPEGTARAVEGFVRPGDALLVLSDEATPRLDLALRAARAGQARLVGLFGAAAEVLAERCDAAVVVASDRPFVVVETAVAMGHVLHGLVLNGLGRISGEAQTGPTAPPIAAPIAAPTAARAPAQPGSRAAPPAPGEAAPSGRAGPPLRVIHRDSESELDLELSPTGHEAGLLRAAIETGLAPPTDPLGRSRRGAPTARSTAPQAKERAPDDGSGSGSTSVVRFACGACGDPMVAEARHAGRRGRCRRCGAELRIPGTQRSGAAPRPSDASGGGSRPGSSQAPSRSEGQGTRGLAGSSSEARSTRSKRSRRERRKSPRFQIRDAQIRIGRTAFPDPRTYHEPHGLDDLSLTGLCFFGRDQDLRVGDVVFLSLDLPAFPQPLLFKADVRRLFDLADGGKATGVRFLESIGEADQKLLRLVDNPQLRDVRRR